MKVVIRTDAYPQLGTGHLMRCLAFGQGIKDIGGNVVFVTYCESEGLIRRLKKEGFDVHQLGEPGTLNESLAIFEAEDPDWVVLDGYHFDGDYQMAVKDGGYRLLYIDDYAHLEHYYADIILNQNYGAEKFSYNAEPHTRLLLGTDYVLLRQEFLEYADFIREIPDVASKLLITMGGSDPENYTLKVLKAVNLIESQLDVKVIIGANNLHYKSIKQEAERGRHNIQLLIAVENMPALMAWADIVISTGGTTTWELAFMRLPALLCIVADNQESGVNALANYGFPSAGWIRNTGENEIAEILRRLLHGKSLRVAIAKKGRRMVDGKGTKRVVEKMRRKPLRVLF